MSTSASRPKAATRRSRWYAPRSIARAIVLRPKVYLAVLAAFAAAMLLPAGLAGPTRAAFAGDVGALVYLAFSCGLMVGHTSESIRRRAEAQDDGAIVILVLTLVAIALSFYTIFGVLAEAKQRDGSGKALLILLAASTILLSWLVTQVAFTFHYAHEHYRPEDRAPKGGLEFLDYLAVAAHWTIQALQIAVNHPDQIV